MAIENRKAPEQLEFVGTVLTEIARDHYATSAEIFLEGLKGLINSDSAVTADEFEFYLAGPLSALIKYKLQKHKESSAVFEATEACCFCGKTKGEVDQLIAGPDIFICDACVRVCNAVLKKNGG